MSDHDAVLVDHPDVQVSNEDQHALALVRPSDTDVVELGPIAQGETARVVDPVAADLGVGQEGLAVDLDGGLVERSPGAHRRAAARGVGALLVVEVDESVDLGLELGQGGGRGLLAQPLLQREVVALDLALGLWMVGLAVLEGDPESGELDLHAGVSAAVRSGVDRAVVAEHRSRRP